MPARRGRLDSALGAVIACLYLYGGEKNEANTRASFTASFDAGQSGEKMTERPSLPCGASRPAVETVGR